MYDDPFLAYDSGSSKWVHHYLAGTSMDEQHLPRELTYRAPEGPVPVRPTQHFAYVFPSRRPRHSFNGKPYNSAAEAIAASGFFAAELRVRLLPRARGVRRTSRTRAVRSRGSRRDTAPTCASRCAASRKARSSQARRCAGLSMTSVTAPCAR
jgi:hypothetical protein